MHNSTSNPIVVNSTFSGNTARNGGGILNNYSSDPVVTNCLLWNNSDNGGIDESAQIQTFSGTPVVAYSCIHGLVPGGAFDSGPNTNNIADDPLLVRVPEPGPDGTWNGVDDDFGDLRLQEDSPCIDAGNSAAVPAGVTTDIAGDLRISGVSVDMGAHEAPATPVPAVSEWHMALMTLVLLVAAIVAIRQPGRSAAQ